MISSRGMRTHWAGQFSAKRGTSFWGREIAVPKNFSDASVELIDEEISRLIKSCETKALNYSKRTEQS